MTTQQRHEELLQTIRDAACLIAAALYSANKNEDAVITCARAMDLSREARRMDLGIYLFPRNAEGRIS